MNSSSQRVLGRFCFNMDHQSRTTAQYTRAEPTWCLKGKKKKKKKKGRKKKKRKITLPPTSPATLSALSLSSLVAEVQEVNGKADGKKKRLPYQRSNNFSKNGRREEAEEIELQYQVGSPSSSSSPSSSPRRRSKKGDTNPFEFSVRRNQAGELTVRKLFLSLSLSFFLSFFLPSFLPFFLSFFQSSFLLSLSSFPSNIFHFIHVRATKFRTGCRCRPEGPLVVTISIHVAGACGKNDGGEGPKRKKKKKKVLSILCFIVLFFSNFLLLCGISSHRFAAVPPCNTKLKT